MMPRYLLQEILTHHHLLYQLFKFLRQHDICSVYWLWCVRFCFILFFLRMITPIKDNRRC